MKRHARSISLSTCILLVAGCASANAGPSPVPAPWAYLMTADAWSAAPRIGWAENVPGALKFARDEGLPAGSMTVNDGVAISKLARFTSGTIDFDMKPLAYSDTGIIFHRRGSDAGEFVYARANPDCPAADDCIQYAPVVHSAMDWNIYSNYQTGAPLAPNGWNHFRLTVADQKMLVYVNHQADPTLVVPRLQALTTTGGIAFKGPAIFANLTIAPSTPGALANLHEQPPMPGTVMNWLTASPVAMSARGAVPASEIPADDAWHAIRAEPWGLVNLGREFGTLSPPAPAIGWLKTDVIAASPLVRTLHIGWCEEITVFLNGKPIFSGRNSYYPVGHRLQPDGRLEPDNASLPLTLKKGKNEIVLAVGDRWSTYAGIEKATPYGWAAEAHFDGLTGLTLE